MKAETKVVCVVRVNRGQIQHSRRYMLEFRTTLTQLASSINALYTNFFSSFMAWLSSWTICELIASSSCEFVVVCYPKAISSYTPSMYTLGRRLGRSVKSLLVVAANLHSSIIQRVIKSTDSQRPLWGFVALLTAHRQQRINTFYSFSK